VILEKYGVRSFLKRNACEKSTHYAPHSGPDKCTGMPEEDLSHDDEEHNSREVTAVEESRCEFLLRAPS
jgi:hypothetical protein